MSGSKQKMSMLLACKVYWGSKFNPVETFLLAAVVVGELC
jgi:hypothetical protein